MGEWGVGVGGGREVECRNGTMNEIVSKNRQKCAENEDCEKSTNRPCILQSKLFELNKTS